MKFETKIYGLPVYMRAPVQPDSSMYTYQSLTSLAQLTPKGSAVYGSPKAWVTERSNIVTGNAAAWKKWPTSGTNVVDVSMNDKEAGTFKVEITSERRVGDHWEHNAVIRNFSGRFLALSEAGLALVDTPRNVKLITTTETSIRNAGAFKIADPTGTNYAAVTNDKSSRPLLGASADPSTASTFRFTWDESLLLKQDVKRFLQVRYFIDHPKLVSDRELLPELEAMYDKLGGMIIARVVGDQTQLESFMPDAIDGEDYSGPDAGTPYFTFPLSSGHNVYTDDYRHIDTTSSKADNGDGVTFQRAVMGEDSTAVTEMFKPAARDAGLRRSADVLLLKAGIQPSAWHKINRMVDPIGTSTDVYPAPVLISKNAAGRYVVGVNMSHPFVAGASGGEDLLFYRRPGDGSSSGGGGRVVYAVPEVPVSTPLDMTSERFCPCGVPGEQGGERTIQPMFSSCFIWLLVILIIVLVIRRQNNATTRTEKKASEMLETTP